MTRQRRIYNPLIIGLTGGIAAGKSLVAAEFVRLGAYLIDADVISREVVLKGSHAYQEIVDEFGSGVLLADGALDRKALGRIIFADPVRRAALNAITHPRIRARIIELIDERRRAADKPFILIDAALLIENKLYKLVDKIVVVDAPQMTLIERMKARDGVTEAEAEGRLAAQMPVNEKRSFADYVIDNSRTAEETREAVDKVYAELKAGAGFGDE
ncbi:MAG: dephospho-CoA kinase [Deltaproteobacteria bacterium RIFCSPLOWO2_02_FULL_53_8]|nr:MAG: dephospho-CoA kinase [Deltaproteobacteria bacterium RIFCSPLOWO2_02_FULL_53_8]